MSSATVHQRKLSLAIRDQWHKNLIYRPLDTEDDYRAREESMESRTWIWGNNLSQILTYKLAYGAKRNKIRRGWVYLLY